MVFSICNCKFMVLGFHHYARSLEINEYFSYTYEEGQMELEKLSEEYKLSDHVNNGPFDKSGAKKYLK